MSLYFNTEITTVHRNGAEGNLGNEKGHRGIFLDVKPMISNAASAEGRRFRNSIGFPPNSKEAFTQKLLNSVSS